MYGNLVIGPIGGRRSSLRVTSGLKGEESESMRRVRAEAEWNRKVNAVVKELQLVKTREKKAQTTISALQSSEVALKGRLLLTEKQNREIKNRLATEEAKYRRVYLQLEQLRKSEDKRDKILAKDHPIIARLEKKVGDLTNEKESIQRSLDNLTDSCITLKNKNRALQREISNLKLRETELQGQLDKCI
ncbi:hypothetical protein ADUPG1_014175 [Aduncisulcus paluster]|uniref:Uncharacterized protein n=1 Tax=Aduncisulcus paluster TaxID=2918883 RepID=A0ABQ5KFT6_9EUKA|nr:hypothetical protein ADUPG1_014175 [Aduncisulcus paluster]